MPNRGLGRGSSGPVSVRQVAPSAYTPTVTWPGNTIASPTGLYLKTPGLLLAWVSFVESAGTAGATLTITMPPGYSAAITGFVGQVVGLAGNIAQLSVTAGSFSQVVSTAAPTGVVTTWTGFFVIPTLT